MLTKSDPAIGLGEAILQTGRIDYTTVAPPEIKASALVPV
jgi:hypothetical protein